MKNWPPRVAATAVVLLSVVSSGLAGIQEDVESLIYSAPLKGATVAVSVRDAETGSELVSINSSEPMIPASNMKLITSGAALYGLGPNFEFSTKLIRDDDRLIVLGDGDPAFGDPELLSEMAVGNQEELDADAFLSLWVDAVVAAGITNVSEIVVDDRIFDREFVHTNWPEDQLNRSYCAEVAGLNFHLNLLHFFPKPRQNRSPVLTNIQPAASWLEVINRATGKSEKQHRNDAWIARPPHSNEFTVYGNVRFEYKSPIRVTVHDMPSFFAQLLASRLDQKGIDVNRHRVSDRSEPASVGETIGPIVVTPISTILERCNKESENLYAECLLKRVAAAFMKKPGSWTNGSAIARHVIYERLHDPMLMKGIVVSDGSGLSRENRITPTMMTAWLNTFHQDETLGPVFLNSLPVANESGTLKKRFKNIDLSGAHVQAKSGYIRGVSCLSGYITMPSGERRTFSVLVNDMKSPALLSIAKKLHEHIVAAVASDMVDSAVTLGSD